MFFACFTAYVWSIAGGKLQDWHWLAPIGFGLAFLNLCIDIAFRPRKRVAALMPLDPKSCTIIRGSSKTLVFICALYLASLTTFTLHESILEVLRSGCVIIGSLVTVLLIRSVVNLAVFRKKATSLTRLANLLLFSCIIGEFSGYTGYSRTVFFGTLGTLIVISVWSLLRRLMNDIFDAFESKDHPWHQRLRTTFRIESEDAQANLAWISFISHTFLLFAMIVALLVIWGLSESSFTWMQTKIVDGFSIGESTIVPIKILIGIIVFFTVMNIGQGISRRTSKGTLLTRKLDPGALETVAKMTTYIGFAIAALVGLTIAGFNFQNLAILAGALSVGIGFGLQNIVNNFVSGIILLFERPVRTGDWVSVGGTEGFIKNIKVRSTEIQTWDRTDVVIPNSEFISQQVTNYTLRDPYGRITIKVGVAYGSNTQLVKEILEKVALDHTAVIRDSKRDIPNPSVIFREFGDSSLNFELRCFIRDITRRMFVLSDINFEIDKRFRDNGVEIPFPQRDLHVRSSINIPVNKSE